MCEAAHRNDALPALTARDTRLKTGAVRRLVAGFMCSTQPLCTVVVDVSIIMMLLITRVARVARRHGSGRTTRGNHPEHAAAAGIAVYVLNLGPYMASPGRRGHKAAGWHT